MYRDRDDTVELSLWIVRETPKAVLFAQDENEPDDQHIWIPRSTIEHMSKSAPNSKGWRECQVEMQSWIAEDKDLL